MHPGYHKAKTYYAVDYSLEGANLDKPDYRTNLYWNPDIQLNGPTSDFQFYTGDKLSEFIILVEGISKRGVPFTASQTFRIGK